MSRQQFNFAKRRNLSPHDVPRYLTCIFFIFAMGAPNIGVTGFTHTTCFDCLRGCSNAHRFLVDLAVCNLCINLCADRTDEIVRYFLGHSCTPLIQAAPLEYSRQRAFSESTAHQAITSSYTELLINYYVCASDLRTEREKASLLRTESRESRSLNDFFVDNQSRFLPDNYTTNFTDDNGSRQKDRRPIVKSGSSYYGGNRIVCPTTYEVKSPSVAKHVSGKFVTLWKYRNYGQHFSVGSCLYDNPRIDVDLVGRCRAVENKHKALFIISQRDANAENSPFTNCRRIKSFPLFFLCDDWVQLNGTCTLFV